MTSVQDQIPHRYPMILVDRVLERETGKRVLAEKNLSQNEPYFFGHFQERPVVPGVLLVEMLCQAAAFLETESLHGKAIFLAQISDARFKSPAIPGDRLLLEVKQDGCFGDLQKVSGSIHCDNRIVCTASLVLKRGEA